MATLPGQMFDHSINASKAWPSMSALDFSAKISSNVTFDLPAGRCCHINSSGELETGVFGAQMPLFNFQGATDYDVNNAGNSQWTPVSPSGRVMCFVGSGGFELETTEFDTTQAYAPNDILYALRANGTLATGGLLTNQTPGPMYDPAGAATMQAVVGVVSRGRFTNAYGVQVVAFFCVYLPGTMVA